MKVKAMILSFLIFMVGAFSSYAHASENDLIGYSVNNAGQVNYLYDSNRHSSTNSSTQSNMNITEEESSINVCSILGDDDRTPVSNSQYTQYPYRCICRILVHYNEEESETWHQGTGFLVGPHTILTNCHVLYDCETDLINYHDYGFFDSIRITFGRHYDSSTNQFVNPYGEITSFSTAWVGNYRNTSNPNDDWGILDLSENIGSTLGYFGVTSDLSENTSVKMIGYPGDYNQCMAISTGYVFDVGTYSFKHTCDSTGGSSGSPVIKNSGNVVCGIHNGGELGDNPTYNTACKISTYIVGWIEDRL